MMIVITYLAAAIAAKVSFWFLINLSLFRRSPRATNSMEIPRVSILIPARNEAQRIGSLLKSIFESDGVLLDVCVLDDQSVDGTGAIVTAFAAQHGNLRLLSGSPIPQSWSGKQFACHQLSQFAAYDELVFVDADVCLAKDAIARAVSLRRALNVDLLSGFPQQRIGTLGEALLIPLIHLFLLCFLPFPLMRWTRMKAAAAGCGQFFLTTKSAYAAAGGHAAIRSSLHDGIKLPRSYRSAGLSTDLFDASDLASCRMYESYREVFSGLGKNAHEGFASVPLLLFVTPVMYLAFIHPMIVLIASLIVSVERFHIELATLGVILGYLPRLICCVRFDRAWLGCLLNPVSIMLFLQIQWSAWFNRVRGRTVEWRSRQCETTTT